MHVPDTAIPPRTLMGPGPSDVPDRVLQAMAKPTIGHLDPAFVEEMEAIKKLLRYAFQTDNRLTMPVSGPGTAGMETCVANLVEPGDTMVVCQNGVFGGRIREMALRCGAEVVDVDMEWGRAVDPSAVEQALDEHPEASVLAFVHAETSTGALSDAETLSEIARRHDCLTLVDAVTSLGGVPLKVDEWGLDAVYSGSQKCLSCTPGLSPLTVSDRAVAAIQARETPVRSWFLDLSLVMDYWGGENGRSYHHTAPINALYGLREALEILHEEGLANAWERHRDLHASLKDGLQALGLEFVVPAEERLPNLNAVTVPDGLTNDEEAEVRDTLLHDYNLEIGAGLGDLAGKVWRIGLMGHSCRSENVERCITALGTVLADHGLDVDPQQGLDAITARS